MWKLVVTKMDKNVEVRWVEMSVKVRWIGLKY